MKFKLVYARWTDGVTSSASTFRATVPPLLFGGFNRGEWAKVNVSGLKGESFWVLQCNLWVKEGKENRRK